MRYAIALLLCCLSGCAVYEYDLKQPAEFARHIGENTDQLVTIEPLEYRLRSVENRLVMRVFNTTDEPIQLVGDQSVVVDPTGESHPLRGQTIAPHSFIKLIFPPIRPQYYDPNPNFGFGVGVGYGSYHHHHRHYRHPHYHSVYYDEYFYERTSPRYLYQSDSDNRYWDWRGEGESRVTLSYHRNGNDFRHEFTFRRIKM